MIGIERYEKFPVFNLFFEFFVIAIFVCHFVYLATSSEDLKIVIENINKNKSNWNWYSRGVGFESSA